VRSESRCHPSREPLGTENTNGYDRSVVAEMWFYPDGSRILELSTKCPPSQAFQVVAESGARWPDEAKI
jgi:hypothetical protein